jgi:hypothetical protein
MKDGPPDDVHCLLQSVAVGLHKKSFPACVASIHPLIHRAVGPLIGSSIQTEEEGCD